ncbi:uncharacterized protein LOC111083407 [Limulus polyphemus]|uniref:Uncharacterized protein LOC111083407 n=1 Tax=Limulus polyphemus TaxID=6850 RepID=A0ABM1RW67_LIMPO|nr:uncharacterized protein LOC111083407 [Limulus polyphemus]
MVVVHSTIVAAKSKVTWDEEPSNARIDGSHGNFGDRISGKHGNTGGSHGDSKTNNPSVPKSGHGDGANFELGNEFGRRIGSGSGKHFQFHEQGQKGPHSYRYGYDTGDSYNPLTRFEERDGNGVVRGYYTYRDPYGKLQRVEYMAHPKLGFRVRGSFGEFPRRGH